MKINLEVHITTLTAVGPNKSVHHTSCYVNDRDYKKDREFTAAIEAYKFVQEIKKEGGYDVVIDKVLLDNEHDITTATRQIRPVTNDSILPF